MWGSTGHPVPITMNFIQFNFTYPEDLKPRIESVFGLVTMEREGERLTERQRENKTKLPVRGSVTVGCRGLLPISWLIISFFCYLLGEWGEMLSSPFAADWRGPTIHQARWSWKNCLDFLPVSLSWNLFAPDPWRHHRKRQGYVRWASLKVELPKILPCFMIFPIKAAMIRV